MYNNFFLNFIVDIFMSLHKFSLDFKNWMNLFWWLRIGSMIDISIVKDF
jgi:hypothetical protein